MNSKADKIISRIHLRNSENKENKGAAQPQHSNNIRHTVKALRFSGFKQMNFQFALFFRFGN